MVWLCPVPHSVAVALPVAGPPALRLTPNGQTMPSFARHRFSKFAYDEPPVTKPLGSTR